MADQKISELTEKTDPVSTDMFAIEETGNTNKKVTWATMLTELGGGDVEADQENLIVHMEVFA